MDLSCLRWSGGGPGYVTRGHYTAVSVAVLGRRSPEKTTARSWRVLWRRLKKEKKRMFSCGCSSEAREVHVPYNPETYLQNFDEGCVMMVGDDPDAISRSFSARFAISSAVLQRPPEFVVQNKVEV